MSHLNQKLEQENQLLKIQKSDYFNRFDILSQEMADLRI